MQSVSQSRAAAAPASGANARRHVRPSRPLAVRVAALQTDRESLRDKAAVLLTGLATAGMVLNSGSAQAADVATVAGNKAGTGPSTRPDMPTSQRSADQLQAELEKRNQAQLSALSSDLLASQKSVVGSLEDLQKKQSDSLKSFVSELEASRQAAVKSVDELQKRVAAEHAAMLKLQGELRSAKMQLDDTQKEVVKEKNLLVAAKQAAENAKKEAAEAAAAARSAELALKGQAGLETLKTPLGIAAASGWSLAAIVLLAKNKRGGDIDWSKVEGKEDILEAMEQARRDSEALRRESESLKRELSSMSNTVSQLTAQLDQERTQRDTLRETILLLEAEVSSMEQRMNNAKTEASSLKKKLEDVKVPMPKRPSLEEILTGSSSSSGSSYSNGSSTNGRSSYSSSSAASSSGTSLNGKYELSSAAKALGATGRAVRVNFSLHHELPFGMALKLVGSHPALGAWDEARGLTMTWTDGHVWVAEVPLPIGTAVEFKAVKVSQNGGYSEWESGNNHVLLIPDSTTKSSLSVRVDWGAGTSLLDENAKVNNKQGKVLATAGAFSNNNSSSNSSSSSSSARKSTSGSASKKWAGLLG